jgi:hypothetical protein
MKNAFKSFKPLNRYAQFKPFKTPKACSEFIEGSIPRDLVRDPFETLGRMIEPKGI